MAKKKTYPTLWCLYRDNLLPQTFFVGYARSKLDIQKFLSETAYPYMKVKPNEQSRFEEFVKKNYYVAGSYDRPESFKELNDQIIAISKTQTEGSHVFSDCNRVFYLALPPSVYTSVTELLSLQCKAQKPHWTRVIVEKPFGKDLDSSNKLAIHLSSLFKEEEIYRIDHYLGKEMVS